MSADYTFARASAYTMARELDERARERKKVLAWEERSGSPTTVCSGSGNVTD